MKDGSKAHDKGHRHHDQTEHKPNKKGPRNKDAGTHPGIFGGTMTFFFILFIVLVFKDCEGCGEDDVCHETRLELVTTRYTTPSEIPEKELTNEGWEFDVLGPAYYHRPRPDGRYDKIEVNPGDEINFQKEYGPRGHGSLKFTSRDLGREVELIFSVKKWEEVVVPCKDGD